MIHLGFLDHRKVSNDQIFLCFDKNSAKTCRIAKNVEFDFQAVGYSLYDHEHIKVAVSPTHLIAAASRVALKLLINLLAVPR